MDKPTKFMCSCNCEQVVKASEYNRLVQALWRIRCMRPHKEAALDMKKIAKEAMDAIL